MIQKKIVFLILAISLNFEERIFAKIFDENRYDKRARPARDPTRAVNISFSYEFGQLYDVVRTILTVMFSAIRASSAFPV